MARPELSPEQREQQRQRMTDAALRLVLEQGAEALSLRTLADALGISHTLPYRYFRNKEALLADVRGEAVGRFEAFVRRSDTAGADPLSRLETLFGAYIEFARRYPDEYRLIFAADQPPPDRYPALLEARRRVFDHAAGVVQACIDARLIQGEAREVAHAYWIALHGLMMLHVANQLVHGHALETLAPALLKRLLGTVNLPAGKAGKPKAVPRTRRRGAST